MSSGPTIDSASIGRSPKRHWVLSACALAAAFDGFDAQMLGFVVPAVARDWGLPVSAFGLSLSMGLLGMIVGALLLAPLGDRFGRRPLIVAVGIGVAVATIATAFANSVAILALLRLITGIGLGALTPLLVAIAYEAPSDRHRGVYVTIVMSAFPTGGFLGGLIVAWVLPRLGWEFLFLCLGFAAIAISTLLFAVLEAVPSKGEARPAVVSPARLFQEGRAVSTLFLWLLFGSRLVVTYVLLSWLPSLISRLGFSDSHAAMITGMMSLGGIAGGLVFGMLFDRFKHNIIIATNGLAFTCLALLTIAERHTILLVVLTLILGFLILGGYICNVVLATAHYPEAMRVTGVGWAQGIGRLGSVGAPALVGLALQAGWSNAHIYLTTASIALLSAGAAFGLKKIGANRRASPS